MVRAWRASPSLTHLTALRVCSDCAGRFAVDDEEEMHALGVLHSHIPTHQPRLSHTDSTPHSWVSIQGGYPCSSTNTPGKPNEPDGLPTLSAAPPQTHQPSGPPCTWRRPLDSRRAGQCSPHEVAVGASLRLSIEHSVESIQLLQARARFDSGAVMADRAWHRRGNVGKG